jgi:2'-hydroxyisoflavone reductase
MIAPGRPDDPVQLVDVRDLGEWMVECNERRHVGVFNATGPERRLSIAQLLDACARAAQSTPELVWIDAAFLERHEVQPWMHMTVWVPPDSESGGMGSVANAKAIAAGLRFRPHVETARDTLAWWRELPAERRAEPRAGLARARETEVLAAWEAGAKTKTSA